jgi:predicted Holliday junction resolvase-like endonuclease
MFGLSSIKYIAILGMILVVVGGMYYVSNLKAELAIERENVKKLETAIETQKQVINQYQQDIAQQQQINRDLQSAAEMQRRDIDSLRKRFTGANLGKLAKVDPNAVESKINRGSANATRCFEIASGSPLTERERNAKDAKEFNPECPSLWISPAP